MRHIIALVVLSCCISSSVLTDAQNLVDWKKGDIMAYFDDNDSPYEYEKEVALESSGSYMTFVSEKTSRKIIYFLDGTSRCVKYLGIMELDYMPTIINSMDKSFGKGKVQDNWIDYKKGHQWELRKYEDYFVLEVVNIGKFI